MKESSLLGVVFVKIVISGFRLKNLANLNFKFSKKSTRPSYNNSASIFSRGIRGELRFKLKIQETGLNPSTIKVNRAVME